MQNKIKISAAIAQEHIKDIRLLAMTGKASFQKFLYDPLYQAGWYIPSSGQNSRKVKEMLEKDSADPAFLSTIAPRCKRLINISMSEGLSVLGNSCIFFLEKMQIHTAISTGSEAIDFINIINAPLGEFRKNSSEKSAKLFTEAVSDVDAGELKSIFDSVKLENDSEKIKLDSEIKRLYENIRIASKYHNIPKCRKLLSAYIIRYSDDADYARNDVERLVTALNNRDPEFENELKNTIAIDLYYRITHGVLDGDILSTIKAIRKYGYIFEGDSKARYFYDIDRMERILYGMISDKGLWGELKRKG